MVLGPLTFAAPLALAGILLLPLLWYLLRVTPPAPRTQSFPPLRLLKGLGGRRQTAARTPPWLLALRLLVAFLLILALSHPLITPDRRAAPSTRPLLLVIDDGWTAAPAWESLRTAALDLVDEAGRHQRPVQVLTTAPRADGDPLALSRLGTAEDAREFLRALVPKPWPADHAAAVTALQAGTPPQPADAVWLTDGLRHPATDRLANALQHLGGLTALVPPAGDRPLSVSPPTRRADGLVVQVRRPAGSTLPPTPFTLRAIDSEGRVVAAQPAALARGETRTAVALSLPADLRADLARLEAVRPGGGLTGVAAVHLLDDGWRRRPVGVVTEASERSGVPLLADTYYVRKALAPVAEVHAGPLDTVLARPLSALVLADTLPPEQDRARLRRWVEGGGVLIRFAGPDLAAQAGGSAAAALPDLLPVRLRAGGRTLGGVLSWTQPSGLAPFPEDSPFGGLRVPEDVTIRAQVLAEPSADLGRVTWARLADGTPLVTGARRGQGWVVLIHTTANAAWTDLPLSGLLPDMLERLIALGTGVSAEAAALPLPPLETLDGHGRLGAPGATVAPLPPTPEPPAISRAHPPGIYGRGPTRRALNMPAEAVALPALESLPQGVEIAGLPLAGPGHLDLQPWLYGAAILLLLFDTLVMLLLRGALPGWRMAALALAVASGLTPGAPARAAEEDIALAAALDTRLAYVKTGVPAVDSISAQGLAALTRTLARRSSAELAEPMALDINTAPLAVFPLLYWPAAEGQTLPDAATRARVASYLDHGGLILFDGRGADNRTALRRLLERLDIPPLVKLPKDHVLTHSFYLLNGLPGRVEGGPVWIGRDAVDSDAVSAVIIGANDWAGAWAREPSGRPLLPVIPGAERQREFAFRAGINMVMYALTGNYKADQVHLPAIMERLTQ